MKIVNSPKTIGEYRVIQDPDEMKYALIRGESFYHWEVGNSLSPIISSGEYVFITPCNPKDVKRGDAVFCIIKTPQGLKYPMVHQVWEISDAGHDGELWFKIGSTMSTIFGWTKEVYGIAKGTDIYQEEIWSSESADTVEVEHEE